MKVINKPEAVTKMDCAEMLKAYDAMLDGQCIELETAIEYFQAKSISKIRPDLNPRIKVMDDKVVLMKLTNIAKCEDCGKEELFCPTLPAGWVGYGISKYGEAFNPSRLALHCPICHASSRSNQAK